MSFMHKSTLALAVLTPLVAGAQNTQSPDPVNATTGAAAPAYESAFKNFRTSADEQAAPDKVWRDANQDVLTIGGKMGGHKMPGAAEGGAPQEHAGHDKTGD